MFLQVMKHNVFSRKLENPAVTPAMQLKEYEQYENYRKVEGDMKCEPGIKKVNVRKLDWMENGNIIYYLVIFCCPYFYPYRI